MPNWCNNSLVITGGDAAFLSKIEQGLSGSAPFGLFQTICPMPEGLKGSVHPPSDEAVACELHTLYGAVSWYEWQCDNWGTKWEADVHHTEFYEDTGELRLSFTTAWSPPEGIYRALAKMGYSIEACYDETGMDFAGVFTNEGDVLINTHIGDVAEAVDNATDGAYSAAMDAGDYGLCEELRSKFLEKEIGL